MSQSYPFALTDLVISELPGEAMIYNFADHQAHCVTTLAHRVLLRCDGQTSMKKIASGLGAAVADVEMAIGQLAQAGLVRQPTPRLANAGRRRALKQLGMTMGLSVAVPMVWSIVAPSVAEAASVNCDVGANGCLVMGQTCGDSMQPAGICNGSLMCVVSGADTCI